MVLVSEKEGGEEMKWICACCGEEFSRPQKICNLCDSPNFDEKVEPIDLRDFFAGCALIMFGTATYADPSKKLSAEDTRAIRAYKQSDAMMEEREK